MPINLSVTTDFVYVRFHGLEGGAAHDYTWKELQPWAEFIIEQASKRKRVYAYFNNDINVRAPENAKMLMEMVGDHTVQATAQEQPRFRVCADKRSRSKTVASR